MGNIVKRAELVTDPVRAPVFDASLAEHAIVSDVGCEGKFCPGVEIVRMIVEPEAELHGCFNGRDAETVCERDMGAVAEETLHHVADDIDRRVGDLIARQRGEHIRRNDRKTPASLRQRGSCACRGCPDA